MKEPEPQSLKYLFYVSTLRHTDICGCMLACVRVLGWLVGAGGMLFGHQYLPRITCGLRFNESFKHS